MKKIRGLNFLSQNAVYDEMDSPIGILTIITSAAGLHAILWDSDRKNPYGEQLINRLSQSKNDQTIEQTKEQLTDYFQGKRKTFHLPLAINGTHFQRQVWQQLLKIPYSTTMSYAEQAQNIGNKNKARAVGLANGANPIPIIIPCHRVIGSNGHLTGFGGGIEKKVYLLELEKMPCR